MNYHVFHNQYSVRLWQMQLPIDRTKAHVSPSESRFIGIE